MNITTPAVLFSTVSLLMSAYLSRFANLAKLMRQLTQEEDEEQEYINHQLNIFCQRLTYIKYLQFCGVLSLLFSTAAMFLLLLQFSLAAKISFIISLILFLFALLMGGIDVYYSMQALSIKLKDEVKL
ncbi:DUF2721 domain-containing protein [Halanaerobacter jeridensis]|uniref:ABC-type multidrug transport system fused ATPase/permease subunit n=1 Tax=Halanaerobacter jeridensis TaxID=706427 RepID=A0A938XQK9_9FIRM|nr:DUF2721 domain-containing protein [Halanaerobacter jeridensis]MBM7555706.1 ABC-type multidrug transport system fused ATPase/permease subunit [Halanaerobacter jeridensis]